MDTQRRAMQALGVALVAMVLGAFAVFGFRRHVEPVPGLDTAGQPRTTDVSKPPADVPLRWSEPVLVDREVKLVDARDPAGSSPTPAAEEKPFAARPVAEAVSPLGGPMERAATDDDAPERALADAHATLVPEPADAAERFLGKARAEAEQAIAALQAERETLSARIQKVDAGLARWQAVLEALKVQAKASEPAQAVEPANAPNVNASPEYEAAKSNGLKPIAPEQSSPPPVPQPPLDPSPALDLPAPPGNPPETKKDP